MREYEGNGATEETFNPYWIVGDHHKKAHIPYDRPTWEDVIHCLDFGLRYNDIQPVKDLGDGGYVCYDGRTLKETLPIISQLDALYGHPATEAHLYISFTSDSKVFEKHNDTAHVWVWNILGTTEWTVWDDGKKVTYMLEPGDSVYVPEGMYHKPNPITPRALLSFGVELNAGV